MLPKDTPRGMWLGAPCSATAGYKQTFRSPSVPRPWGRCGCTTGSDVNGPQVRLGAQEGQENILGDPPPKGPRGNQYRPPPLP